MADIHELAERRLQRIRQRYTPGRRELVDVLAATERPLTIPEIVEQGRDLSTSSVYRNLGALEQAGVATKVVTNQDHARYELAEQLSRHHHHLVCVSCGAIADFTLPDDVELQLDRALARVGKRAGYTDLEHRLDLVGTCPDCA